MLALAACFSVAWTMSGRITPHQSNEQAVRMSHGMDRREVAAGLAAAVLAAPLPAFAQRSALIPKSSKESAETFKAYQLSKPKYEVGQESSAFKAAEAKRASGGAAGVARKEETAEETMKRLGISTYSDGLAAGKPDPCGPGSFACGRSATARQ